MRVTEAQDVDIIVGQQRLRLPRPAVHGARVGSRHFRASREDQRAAPRRSLRARARDRLFRSAAPRSRASRGGVILTGMGDDGVDGAKAIRDAGGLVIAESQETAVVYGMPGAAVRAGVATEVDAFAAIGDYLAALT